MHLRACLASACVLAASLSCYAAPITYTVNRSVGSGSVVGTIVTDGAVGSLSSSDITSFNLLLNDGTGSATLSSSSGAAVYVSSTNLVATVNALFFNFNSNGGFLNFYNSATCSPAEWSFETVGSGTACNGTSGNQEGVSAVLPGGSGTYSDRSGLTQFATASSVTPEPSSLALLGTGILGVAGVVRRRFA